MGRVGGLVLGVASATVGYGSQCSKRLKVTWLRDVTASSLDSESSDRGSNPREALTRTTVCFVASYDQREGRDAWGIAGAPRGESLPSLLTLHAFDAVWLPNRS